MKVKVGLDIYDNECFDTENYYEEIDAAIEALKEIQSQQKVLNFFEDFKKEDVNALENTFSYGYCYWFAFILMNRFNGELYYLPIENHFITKINNSFYDIKGLQSAPSTSYKWEDYKLMEPLDASRVEKYCIRKED